jgi:hypothetical protein
MIHRGRFAALLRAYVCRPTAMPAKVPMPPASAQKCSVASGLGPGSVRGPGTKGKTYRWSRTGKKVLSQRDSTTPTRSAFAWEPRGHS